MVLREAAAAQGGRRRGRRSGHGSGRRRPVVEAEKLRTSRTYRSWVPPQRHHPTISSGDGRDRRHRCRHRGLGDGRPPQRRGHSVTVIEERTDTGSGAGISIWPNALAALDAPAGDRVRAGGGRVTGGRSAGATAAGCAGRRRADRQRARRAVGGDPAGCAAATSSPAHSRPAPSSPGSPPGRCGSTGRGSWWSCRTRRSAGADVVIGADGTHSVVARHLNGPLAHRYAGYTAARCRRDGRGRRGGRRDDRTGRGGGPRADGRRPDHWFATERVAEAGACSRGTGLTCATSSQRGGSVPAMLAATDPAAVLRNDLGDRDPARRWADGPVVVAGDAAHPMWPHRGQGRLSGARGCCGAGRDGRPPPVPARVRGLRVVPPASGGRGGSRVADHRTAGQPAAAGPQRGGKSGERADAGGTGDPAPGHNRRGHGLPTPARDDARPA